MWSSKLALGGLVSLLALAIAVQPRPAQPATVQVLRTAGAAATLTDSRGGGAILSASNMGAGHSVTGDVRLAFDGDANAAITLTRSAVVDAPGFGGGQLSQALLVAVDDLTSGRELYAGPLATMPAISAGQISPGGVHDYRLTVTLPRSAGNEYQGSSAQLGYVWTATDAPVAPPPPVPPTPPTPPTPPPTPDVTPPKLTVAVKRAQRSDRLALDVLCDERCTLSATARVLGIKNARPKVKVVRTATGGTLRFTFSKPLLTKMIRKGRVVLEVTMTAVDAAGNRTVRKQRVTLTFSRAPKHPMHPVRIAVGLIGGAAPRPHRPTSLHPPRHWLGPSTGRR